MEIKGGYILQPRCFDTSDAAHFPPCTREVWFYLLRNVNHTDNGKYKRGGGFFALEDLQDALSWSVGYRVERYSKPQLTKALRRLREGSMIETAKATRGLYVTVLNYDKYQDPKMYEGNGEGNAKETRRKREGMHIEQECKNERMKEEKKQIKAEKFNHELFKPECVSTELWQEFIDNRKFKKLQNTKTALKLIMASFEKGSGQYSYTEMLSEYIAARWQRFDPSWMKKGTDNNQQQPQSIRCHQCDNEHNPNCVKRTDEQRLKCTHFREVVTA